MIRTFWKYNRFFIGTWVVLVGIPMTLLGGAWPITFLVATVLALFISELFSGRYEEEPTYEASTDRPYDAGTDGASGNERSRIQRARASRNGQRVLHATPASNPIYRFAVVLREVR